MVNPWLMMVNDGRIYLVGADWNHGFLFMTFQKQLGMECHDPN